MSGRNVLNLPSNLFDALTNVGRKSLDLSSEVISHAPEFHLPCCPPYPEKDPARIRLEELKAHAASTCDVKVDESTFAGRIHGNNSNP